MQSFTSVPFKTESEHGLKSFNGVAKFSRAGLVLEFEGKIFGLVSEGVKECRLALGEILDVRFKKGLFRFGAKIVIRPRSLAAVSELPNNGGRLILKLAREDFELGREAAEQLERDLAQLRAELPPPQMPVNRLFDPADEDEDTREFPLSPRNR